MKRAGGVFSLIFALWPLLALSGEAAAGGLPQLKRDFSDILCNLLSCYEQTRERNYLEMAVHFGELRTHPIFELAWGKHRQFSTAERELLQASKIFCDRLKAGSCPPPESEVALCRRAQSYILAVDGSLVTARKASLRLPEPCGLDEVQKGLSARQVLLKYVLLEDRMLLFYVSADSAGYEFLTVGRGPAVDMINRLSEPLEDFANGRVDYLRIHFDMELAHRLFNIFLKKMTERFPRADEFFIIPDQELYKLPFEALVMGFNRSSQQEDVLFSEYQAADYVIQKYRVSYFFSYADFLRRFSGRKEYPYTLAAFGNPLLQKGGGRGMPSLEEPGGSTIADIPSTRLEILSLERLFAGSRRCIFLGADFNWENFSRFAPQAKLIHVASHFFNNETDPSRSAFLLSASGKVPALCDTRQILALRLRAELVILSACETSEKNLLGFKLLSGMTAAIRQAGVRDLIASLWPVDEFSSQIVPLFYSEYLSGQDSATALRNAKLSLFAKTIPIQDGVRLSLAHPFLWANYVLYHFCR
jgi:CHAT domain-containing protein